MSIRSTVCRAAPAAFVHGSVAKPAAVACYHSTARPYQGPQQSAQQRLHARADTGQSRSSTKNAASAIARDRIAKASQACRAFSCAAACSRLADRAAAAAPGHTVAKRGEMQRGVATQSSPSAISKIRERERVLPADLQDLFDGKITAIRVPNFCPIETRGPVVKKMQERGVVEYENAEGVGKVKGLGMAYFEAETAAGKEKYRDQVISSFDEIRDLFSPQISPVDKLRVQLDERWPQGANLLNFGKRSMFVGLIRAIAKDVKPHEDKLERDDPVTAQKVNYVSQVAFNCYLSMPTEGGAIELWDFNLDTPEYDRLRKDSYGIERSELPAPSAVITPEEGELILFMPRNLHAVSEAKGGTRLTASGFILSQGEEKPLLLWS